MSGSGPDVGLVLGPRCEVTLRAEPGAGEQDLADLQQQQRDGASDVALAGDGLEGDQEALDLVGDLLGELPGLAVELLWLIHSADRLPANALPKVTSSAYSRSPPTGSPLANRVTRNPIGLSNRVR